MPDDVGFPVPSELGRADITASLTVQYRTSAGDGARLIARMRPPTADWAKMRPGPFTLGPAAKGTTTTVTWTLPNQEPTGDEFTFSFEITKAPGERPTSRARVSEAVLVLTATPG